MIESPATLGYDARRGVDVHSGIGIAKQAFNESSEVAVGLLIDGYNLAYASGILAAGRGGGALERARGALLNVLAASLSSEDAAKTVVVFDANDAYVSAADVQQHAGIQVRYAVDEADADTLIEQLITENSAPRQLLVVSSDHRIQRAAKRRRAKAVDSEVWYEQLLKQRGETSQPQPPVRPDEPLSDDQVEFWMREFGVDE